MTSQLNVDTIVDKAGSGGSNVKMANTSTYVSDGGNVTQNTVQGLAKVWIKTAGNGTSISDSLNVSTLGDTGTGQQTVSFTNAMGNEEYAITSTLADAGSYSIACANQAAGSFRGYYFNIGGSAYYDGAQRHVATGDLA